MTTLRLAWIEHGSADYAAEVALRDEVLRKPLGLSFTPEQLAAESDSRHLLAWDGDALVGCLLLTPRGNGIIQMRQVAVSPTRQGGGVGRALVVEAERRAAELGCTRMMLHARDTAVAFYLRLGYHAGGEPFVEVGIPHREMEKELHPGPAPNPA
ncbi:MAG TPA: GNAT family N-acetyltransferase [Holophagaceae bacterium]|nr:GNAT family N-acetyltransferase [Holophagaceae bacterium]